MLQNCHLQDDLLKKGILPTVVHGQHKVLFQFTRVMHSKNQWEIFIMTRECW